MNDLLTPEQQRRLRSVLERCGACRQLADTAAALGRNDEDFRTQVETLEGAAKSALDMADMVKRSKVL